MKYNREVQKIWDSSKEYTVAEINQSNGWNNKIINFLVQSVLNEGKLAEIIMQTKIKCIFEMTIKIWRMPGWE